MKRIVRYLLLIICLLSSFSFLKINIYAADTCKLIKLTGIYNVKIYTMDKKQEIEVKDKSFTVVPGEYCY